jgi:hypothetical protein
MAIQRALDVELSACGLGSFVAALLAMTERGCGATECMVSVSACELSGLGASSTCLVIARPAKRAVAIQQLEMDCRVAAHGRLLAMTF